MREKTAPPNEIVAEGIDAFPENEQIISNAFGERQPLTAKQLLEYHHPRYHGTNRPECILVRKRREKTYNDHYLDIYGCLTHGLHLECLHSGWEIGWWGGVNVKEL